MLNSLIVGVNMLKKEPLEPDDWILPRKCPTIDNDGLRMVLFYNLLVTGESNHVERKGIPEERQSYCSTDRAKLN